jgi:hypothetical protein
MRDTGFWKKFISDSLFSSEKNFGSFLNVLKTTTGAGLSGGIDELYFSNSWIGDNAIVVKGIFDRNKIEEFVSLDTIYKKQNYPGNITVYNKSDVSFYFYFKDEFTVCASNYLKQIENTFNITDTSQTGLLTNDIYISSIENIKYKENLWMISGQKLFIRGIFENFADIGGKKKNIPEVQDSTAVMDTNFTDSAGTMGKDSDLHSIYKHINTVSFSVKMADDLQFVMQNECEDEKTAAELRNKLEGILALIKISSQFTKKKPDAELTKLLDGIKINTYDKTVLLEAFINEKIVVQLRKEKFFLSE